jgi:hypothetical protein
LIREETAGPAPTRCPYCHEQIEPAEFDDCVVCESCLSRHHADCWEGRCASCKTTAVLVLLRAAPLQQATWNRYELAKRWLNRAWAATVLGFLASGALALATSNSLCTASTGAAVVLAYVFLGLWGPLFALNLADAVARWRRSADTGFLPVVVALTGAVLGIASFAYYLGWGWQPLPSRPASAPSPPHKPTAKG